MKEKILQMVDAYWKFDNQQQPISSWQDKQDLLKALEELLQPAVSGRSEQFYCVSSNALVYGKPCEKWCGDENCKALCKQ